MKTILVKLDSKGKFREVEFELNHSDNPETYTINRRSGLVEGKLIEQPEIKITSGKVKRTIKEQAELQYNSLIKQQLDKGYKVLEDDVELTQVALTKIMPKENTDQNGNKKPMLCKVYDFNDLKNNNIEWWISRKHDGVRCMLFYKDGEVKTSSRGGQDYDIPTTYIRTDPFIKQVFNENPELILDGEIYKHGWPLNKISGLCRLMNVVDDHKQLKFHCYDIVDEKTPFKDRLKKLKAIDKNNTSDKLVIVKHYQLDSTKPLKEQIMSYHDAFIADGYEGAVVRDGNAVYKCEARDRRMQKIKLFSDDEFKIKGLVEGLRDEDLCFLMETKEGYEFKAKPIGDRQLKQYYRDNIDSIIGKTGTVKFFGYTNTENPVPNLPVFKCVRDDKDI